MRKGSITIKPEHKENFLRRKLDICLDLMEWELDDGGHFKRKTAIKVHEILARIQEAFDTNEY
jgi:hypothetical protein